MAYVLLPVLLDVLFLPRASCGALLLRLSGCDVDVGDNSVAIKSGLDYAGRAFEEDLSPRAITRPFAPPSLPHFATDGFLCMHAMLSYVCDVRLVCV